MQTSTNVHHADTVRASAMDCTTSAGRQFTSLSLAVRGKDGRFDVTIFGLDPSYARRLAEAISAVAAEDGASREAA